MQNNCLPNFPGQKNPGGIAEYLVELLQLSPAQLIGVSIQMEKLLGAATLSGSTEYKVPSDRDLVVFGIASTFRSNDLDSEIVTNAIFTAFSYEDMKLIRMANCKVALLNKDRQLKVFDNNDLQLDSLYKQKLEFPPMAPLLVPATHVLQSTFTLQDSSAAVCGQNAYYGVRLDGVLIPKRV